MGKNGQNKRTLIISYIISVRLPFEKDISFLIWAAIVVVLTLTVDYILGRFISKPISNICKSAQKIAGLDFSSHCEITSKDEFGSLREFTTDNYGIGKCKYAA